MSQKNPQEPFSVKDWADQLANRHQAPPFEITPEIEAYNKRLNEAPKEKLSISSSMVYNLLMERIQSMLKKPMLLTEQLDHVYQTMSMYFAGDKEFENRGKNYSLDKGILFRGPIGCGKTFLFKCLTNGDHHRKDLQFNLPLSFPKSNIVSCKTMEREFGINGYAAIDKYTKRVSIRTIPNHQYMFDDLGTESVSTSNYANKANVMETLIMERYDMLIDYDIKTHITTNLVSGDAIEELYGPRVRSRFRQMFNVISWENKTDLRS